MSKNFTKYFKIKKYSRGYDKETKKLILDMKEEIDSKNIQKVIKVTGIRADRAVSNDEGNHALSILTSRYYETYRKNIKDESNSIFQELEVELEKADRTLYKIYNIEEPEAHTHPQLQYIFIRNIKNHINSHRNKLNKEKNKYLQIIITSHSSHIVSECNFDDIIYLKRIDNNILAKNFNSLKEEYGGDEKKRI